MVETKATRQTEIRFRARELSGIYVQVYVKQGFTYVGKLVKILDGCICLANPLRMISSFESLQTQQPNAQTDSFALSSYIPFPLAKPSEDLVIFIDFDEIMGIAKCENLPNIPMGV